MIEKRRVRFACIDGIGREDLNIAAEIWLDDLSRQSWTTRDVLKLATLMKRYMTGPEPRDMLVRSIERLSGLDRKMVHEALRQMHMFGAVEGYGLDGDIVRVSLTLSVLQRLRVLEVRERLRTLGADVANRTPSSMRQDDARWIPPVGAEPETDEECAASDERPEAIAEPA